MQPLDALPPGARLGDLVIVSRLGQGGMGVVYEARDERLDRRLAVKVPSRAVLEDPAARARFDREARAAARVEHPHVAAIHQVGAVGAWPYLVLELLPGGSLRGLLRRGPLPWPEACALVRQVALGLEAIHAAGLVHRDLKPENVLLDGQGRAKVTDFGLVRGGTDPGDLTRTGQLLGTPAYLAPEQVDHARTVGPAADLYALGCTLFELVAGAPPFPGSGFDVITKHLQAAPPRLPGVPPALDGLVQALLAKDPAARPASARAVVEALDALTAAPPAGRPAGVGARVLVAGALAATSLAAGAAWALGRGDRASAPPPTATQAPPPTATQASPPTATQAPPPTATQAPPPPARVEARLVPGRARALSERTFQVDVTAGGALVSTDALGGVRLWAPGLEAIQARADAPDGYPLVRAAGDLVATVSRPLQDPVVRLWGAADLARRGEVPHGLLRTGETAKVWSLDVAPGGALLAVASDQGEVVVLDAAGGRRRLAGAAHQPVVVLRADLRRAYAGDRAGRVVAWDLSRAGDPLAPSLGATAHPVARVNDQKGVTCLAVSPDGRTAVTGGTDGWVAFTALDAGPEPAPRRAARRLPGAVAAAAISPDGRAAVSGDAEGGLALWDLAAGTLLAEAGGPRRSTVKAVLFTAPRRLVAVVGDEAQEWEVAGLDGP